MASPFQPAPPKRLKRKQEPTQKVDGTQCNETIHGGQESLQFHAAMKSTADFTASVLPSYERKGALPPSTAMKKCDGILLPVEPLLKGKDIISPQNDTESSDEFAASDSLSDEEQAIAESLKPPKKFHPSDTDAEQKGFRTKMQTKVPVSLSGQQHYLLTSDMQQEIEAQRAEDPKPWFILNHNSDPVFHPDFDHDGRQLFHLLAFLHKHHPGNFKQYSKHCWNAYTVHHSRPCTAPPVGGNIGHKNDHGALGLFSQPAVPNFPHPVRRHPRLDSREQNHNFPVVQVVPVVPVKDIIPAPHISQNGITQLLHGTDRLIAIRNELKKLSFDKLNAAFPTNWRNHVPLRKMGMEEAYEILEDDGDGQPVALLPAKIVRPYERLQLIDGRLALGHAEAIRFLWMTLVRQPVSGAVLSEAMGTVRIHQVLAFSAMYQRTAAAAPVSRILVVVYRHSEWKAILDQHSFPAPVFVLPDETQTISAILMKWQQQGGLLVCSEQSYLMAVSERESSKGELARKALCRPGPDIVIMDEASRLGSMSPKVYRMLRRTQTSARLAITSLSLAGNLATMWTILDWIRPRLLGDWEEFQTVYVHRITKGHVRDSPAGEQAYRAAAHLAEIVIPLVFPAFGTYGLNKLENRPLEFDSVTLYTNLQGNQIFIYNIAARFLSKRVNRQELSSYVAAHVLQAAATSIEAFKKLLRCGADDYIRCASSVRLQRSLRRVRRIFEELEDAVSRYTANGDSSKFHIAVEMHRYCMRRNEKILMFANSVEVQSALHEKLKQFNPSGAQIFRVDLNAPYDSRSRHLAEFRRWKQGAVLIAPYGPTAECRESAGWADLQVSRVLIMDPGWHIVSEAQCLKRLMSPRAEAGAPPIQVIHLATAGTIEQRMYKSTLRKFDNEFSRLQQCDETTTPRHDQEDRAYLVCPEIPENWISDREYPHRKHAEQAPKVDDDPVTNEIMQFDDGLLTQLLTVCVKPHQYAVRELSCRRNRCVAVANVAEICTRVPLNTADRHIAREEAARGTWEHFTRSRALMARLESMNCLGSESCSDFNLDDLIRPEDQREEKNFRVPGESSSACVLAACWEPYYDLYDKERERRLNDREPKE